METIEGANNSEVMVSSNGPYLVEDLPTLAEALLKKHAKRYRRNISAFDKAALDKLLTYSDAYPMIEDLDEIIERGVALCEGDLLLSEHLLLSNSPYQGNDRINLYKYKFFDAIIKKKIFPDFLANVVLIAFFLNWFSLYGSPLISKWGNIFIWTLGWPVLILTTANLGRVSCALCPMAAIGSKIQKFWSFNKPLPEVFKKYGYLITTFSFVFVFWVEEFVGMHNNPIATSFLILTIVSIASFTFVIFPRHTWCSSICPLGNFISVVAMASPVELRTDNELCRAKCTYHFCYRGSKKVEGCTLSHHAPYVDNSLACKLCMNCSHSCPFHSVRINLRKPGAEIPELTYINRGMVVFVVTVLAMIFPVEYFESFKAQLPFEVWRIQYSYAYWTTVAVAMIGSWLYIRKKVDDPKFLKTSRMIFALSPTMTGLYIAHHLKFLPIKPSNWVLYLAIALGVSFSLFILRAILKNESQKIPEETSIKSVDNSG